MDLGELEEIIQADPEPEPYDPFTIEDDDAHSLPQQHPATPVEEPATPV